MIERKPFETTKLEEERDKRYKNLVVRLNQKDIIMLKEMAALMDTPALGRALKDLAWIGKNALHSTFGAKILKRLMRKERSRLSETGRITTEL